MTTPLESFFRILGVFCLTAIAACAADRPNVLILMSDDQGMLDIRCFGSTDLHTPNIDTKDVFGHAATPDVKRNPKRKLDL